MNIVAISDMSSRSKGVNFAMNKDIFYRKLEKIDWKMIALGSISLYFIFFVLVSRNLYLTTFCAFVMFNDLCEMRNARMMKKNDMEHVTRLLTNRYVRRAVSVS